MIDTAEQQRRFPHGVGDWASGYFAVKPMEDGRFLVLMPLALNRARISIAEDEWSLGEGWCYDTLLLAFASFVRYPEPPICWTRHMLGDGRNEYPDHQGDVQSDGPNESEGASGFHSVDS